MDLQDKLFSMLKKDALRHNPNVDIVKLHKSGGVVSRSTKYRKKIQSIRVSPSFLFLFSKFPFTNALPVGMSSYEE